MIEKMKNIQIKQDRLQFKAEIIEIPVQTPDARPVRV
jgi:hypothetical protein